MAAPVIRSSVNPAWILNTDNPIVSLINVTNVRSTVPVASDLLKITRGHAIAVVEYLRPDGTRFTAQYDIQATGETRTLGDLFQGSIGNSQGYIHEVRTYDTAENPPEPAWIASYSRHSSQQWRTSHANAARFARIMNHFRLGVEIAEKTGEPLYKYQVAGSNRFVLLGGNGGDNCVTFLKSRMEETEIIAREALWGDSIKASPERHVTHVGNSTVLRLVYNTLNFLGLRS